MADAVASSVIGTRDVPWTGSLDFAAALNPVYGVAYIYVLGNVTHTDIALLDCSSVTFGGTLSVGPDIGSGEAIHDVGYSGDGTKIIVVTDDHVLFYDAGSLALLDSSAVVSGQDRIVTVNALSTVAYVFGASNVILAFDLATYALTSITLAPGHDFSSVDDGVISQDGTTAVFAYNFDNSGSIPLADIIAVDTATRIRDLIHRPTERPQYSTGRRLSAPGGEPFPVGAGSHRRRRQDFPLAGGCQPVIPPSGRVVG